MQFEVPDPIEAEIRRLRREAAKNRIQRRECRAELESLQAELEALRDRVRRWRSSTGEGFGIGSYDSADADFTLLVGTGR